MGCLEFWVVNSFLAALAFFILFLVVDAKTPFYPYAVAGGKSRDYSKSATACIVAAAVSYHQYSSCIYSLGLVSCYGRKAESREWKRPDNINLIPNKGLVLMIEFGLNHQLKDPNQSYDLIINLNNNPIYAVDLTIDLRIHIQLNQKKRIKKDINQYLWLPLNPCHQPHCNLWVISLLKNLLKMISLQEKLLLKSRLQQMVAELQITKAHQILLNLWLQDKKQSSNFHITIINKQSNIQLYYFWFATRKEQTKVHVDFGKFNTLQQIEYQNILHYLNLQTSLIKCIVKQQNLFANVQFYNSSSKSTIRFGSVYEGQKCLSHARFEWLNQDKVNFLLRSQVKHNNWVYVIASQVCLSRKEFDKLDFLVGYQTQNYDVYFRHLTNQIPSFPLFSNFGFGKFLVDAVFRKNTNQYGFEIEYTPVSRVSIQLAASTKFQGADVKARLNVLNKTVGLSAKGKFNNTFSWTLATAVPIDGTCPQKCGILPVPLGITLETTI